MISKHGALAALAAIAISVPARAAVTISAAATLNMNCTGGVCAPTANDAILNVSQLESLLASGNVVITTTGEGGIQADNVKIAAAFGWLQPSSLTIDAFRSIQIQKKIAVTGSGGLSVLTNDGGKRGVITYGRNGSVTFASLSDALVINGAQFTLVADIDTLASDIAANPSGLYALAAPYNAKKHGVWNSSPIPTAFSGTFDELGNAISGLAISARYPETDVALFSTLAGGTLNHVRLISAKLHANGAPNGPFINVAPLVGTAYSGTFFEDSATGTISGENKYQQEIYAAGLVGTNYANIISANADVDISLRDVGIGGLVGDNWGTVTQSHAEGAVSGGGYAFLAGLTAYNARSGIIELSSSSATVTFVGEDTDGAQNGGLVGENQGVIDQCFSTGSVSGGYVGGLVGSYDGSTIKNSYATGAASGDKGGRAAGGLIGGAQNGGEIENVYSTGAVSSQNRNAYRGGLVGDDFDEQQVFTDSYWDTDTSGITNLSHGAGTPPNDPGITGLTSQGLQSGLPPGFQAKIWAENPSVNNGFPYLLANPPQ